MYDKFDKLQVALINVFRTQLANMGTQLEERIDKRIGQHLQRQTEQLSVAVKAAVDERIGALEKLERELAGLDEDVDEDFPTG